MRGNRWSPASGECSLRIYGAASASLQAISRLRDRFDLPDDIGYLHIQWQEDPPRLDEPQEQVSHPAAASNPVVQEMVVCASSIEAQVVHMRQPELLADGAGKVELLMELSSMPRASDGVVAAQMAQHHHPAHEHGLFSVIVCFEALAALAPVLRLDSKDHPPNHRRLERWLVHLPPWAYSRHTRSWIMWAMHTLLPFATVLWGLWQLYFNIDVVHRAVNDAFRIASEFIERLMGPILSTVSRVIGWLNTWLVEITEQFNVWLRPLTMVLQPLATAGLAAGRALTASLGALVGFMQLAWSMISEPLRNLVRPLQPVWKFLRSAATEMATYVGRSFVLLKDSACVIQRWASTCQVRAAKSATTCIRCIKSSRIAVFCHNYASRLPLNMKFKPQTDTKLMAAHITKLARNVKPVARAAAQLSEHVGPPLDFAEARESIELREARKDAKED